MSGGTFDGDWSGWGLGHVAHRIGEENPVFGEWLKDANELIGHYDKFLACDINEEDIEREWTKFRDKWLNVDESILEHIREKAVAEAAAYVDMTIKGYDARPKWWEVGE